MAARKGKDPAITSLRIPEEEEEGKPLENEASPIRYSPRNASSKYDFVKVKVWLGENADHYYVFSRFLLCRILNVTKIPNHVTIKIALELKKLLVDNGLLDVSQSDLEANLFKLMERRGYGEEYINRYKMMTRFHHQRVPLVILVCGTACVEKSTIATQLAQMLNLPNVLQTDMVYELLRTSTDAPLASSPAWARDFSSSEDLIAEFHRECRTVQKGLDGDLKKAMKDGKPIIIEGIHLDPSIYLQDKQENLQTPLCTNEEEPSSIANDKIGIKDPGTDLSSVRTESSGSEPQPIIVPIIVRMAELDHEALLEEWISTSTSVKKYPIQDKNKLVSNLKIIQDYLCSLDSQDLKVIDTSETTIPQTLDHLHDHLLQCIEQGISPTSGGSAGISGAK